MTQHETDWRTILLLVGAAGGAVTAYGLAALMILLAGFGAVNPSAASDGRSAFDYFVLAAAPVVIGTMFLPAIYYSIRRLVGKPATGGTVPVGMPDRANPVSTGSTSNSGPIVWSLLYGLIVAIVWVVIAVLAGRLVSNSILKWATPLLYVLAILIPAGFFVWIAIRGINPGSLQRRWGALAAGIGLGIVPAMLAEMILLFIFLVGLVAYLAVNPGQLATVQNLARELQHTNDIGQVMNIVGPLLTNPIVLLLALLFFSGFSPFIEEIAKSLAAWTVFDRISSPAQGFAIGAISGAAFGLVESLLVSATPDPGWASTLLVRGASTMMHIMSAGLTGWGIGRFRTTRRVLPLIEMYIAAMTLHGLWNGSVVAITIGSVRSATTSGGRDLPGMLLVYIGAAVLVLLCVVIPVTMWTINWRLRSDAAAQRPAPPAPLAPGAAGTTVTGEAPSPPAPLP